MSETPKYDALLKLYPFPGHPHAECDAFATVEGLERELSTAQDEIAKLKANITTVTNNAVALLLRCDKHPNVTLTEIRLSPCSVCAGEEIAKLKDVVRAADKLAASCIVSTESYQEASMVDKLSYLSARKQVTP
jgi:hypothetical protein